MAKTFGCCCFVYNQTLSYRKEIKNGNGKVTQNISGQVKSATVSQMPSGKYYVSILVETEHGELPHTNGKTDLDLGIKDLCITSDGNKYENPRTIKKYEKKLTKLQRQLAQTDGLTVGLTGSIMTDRAVFWTGRIKKAKR